MDLGSVNAPPPLYTGTLAWAGQSSKLQASSLTAGPGDDRMNLERNNMNNEIDERLANPLIRIADALEEILRLVKEDQEKMRKISEKN